MPVSLIPSFLFYCSVTGVTPGPANLSSLSAAMHYGKKRALVQWRGMLIGFTCVSVAAVFVTYYLGTVIGPYVRYLAWIGAAYIVWLAYHILRSGDPAETSEQEAAKNCNFLTGLFIQLTNIKVMLLCLTALSSYVLPYHTDFWILLMVGLILPLIGGPMWNLIWLFAGAALQDFFKKHYRPLNILMAAALLACAVSLVWPR